MGDHAAGVAAEKRQQLKFLWGQFEFGTRTRNSVTDRIDLKIADTQQRDFGLALHAMTQSRAHSREELADVKRLIDVVIGAKIERFDYFGFALARRQYDDRNIRPFVCSLNNILAVFAVRSVF